MIKKTPFISLLLFFIWSLSAQTYFGDQNILFEFDGYSGNSISTCDIDGDGDTDFLVAPKSNDTLAWYENTDSNGTLGEAYIISDTANGSIRTCDIDSDGDPDVLAASSNGIAWYENTDGEGTFGEPQIIPGFTGTVYTCDIDGDGDPDILKTSSYEIAWNENTDGEGTFGEPHIIPGFAGKVYFCDINGDGDQDVLKDGGSEIAWNENIDGNGTFGEEQLIAMPYSSSVIPCDIDGDGDQDFFLATGGFRISGVDDYITWYENTDGKGTFAKQANIITYNTNSVGSISVCDIDGDGDLDFLTTRTGHYGGNGLWDGSYQIAWYENTDGNGNFGAAQGIIDGWVTPHDPVCVLSIHTYDIDGDGDLDVLSATSFNDKIAWYINTDGNGTFNGEQVIVGSTDFPQSARTCDIDGDGDQDVFSRSSFSKTTIGWYEDFIFTGVPEILEQPQSVEVCLGDTVTLEVITDEEYYYQWHTSIWDDEAHVPINTPIEGEISNTLTINTKKLDDPFGYSNYYSLRIASISDTIWSNRVYIKARSIPRMDDTIYMCNLDQKLAVHPLYLQSPYLEQNWSPGIVDRKVPDYGKYWVQFTDTFDGITCTHTDTFEVVPPPSVVKLSGAYSNFQYICSDTVIIAGETEMEAGFLIDTGATVVFMDDYELEAYYLLARGSQQDSIRITAIEPGIGSIKVENGALGYPYAIANELEFLCIMDLRSVSMDYLRKSKVSNCSMLRVEESDSCWYDRNHYILLNTKAEYAKITRNDSIRVALGGSPKSNPRFNCSYCLFENNKTGVYFTASQPAPEPSLSFSNSKFMSNSGTPLVISGISTSIIGNVFSGNYSNKGSGVFDFSGNGLLYFINNTMFNNKGTSSNGIKLPFTEDGEYLYNNIFWNAYSSESDIELLVDSMRNSEDTFFLAGNSLIRNGIKAISLPDGCKVDTLTLYNAYPEFADTLLYDLQLQCGSPAIDVGSLYDWPDMKGNPRNFGLSTDLGAYEYIPFNYPEILYSPKEIFFCIKDSTEIMIETNDCYAYQWYKNSSLVEGAVTNSIVVSSPDSAGSNFYILRINNLSDTIWSNAVRVSTVSAPLVTMQTDSVKVCETSDTTIQLSYASDISVVVTWYSQQYGELTEKADTIELNNIISNDKLYAIVENTCGADTSDTINVIVMELPVIDLGSDTSIHANANLLLDAGVGYNRYLWNDNSIDQYRIAYAGDTVWCRITDKAGCSGSDTIIITLDPLDVKILDGKELSVKIYPIPAEDILTIKLPEEMTLPCTLSIFNLHGELLKQHQVQSMVTKLMIEDIEKSGLYILEIRSDKFIGTMKFLIDPK